MSDSYLKWHLHASSGLNPEAGFHDMALQGGQFARVFWTHNEGPFWTFAGDGGESPLGYLSGAGRGDEWPELKV